MKNFCLILFFLCFTTSDNFSKNNEQEVYKVIDDVIIPVPSEIFKILNQLGKPNWSQYIYDKKYNTFEKRIYLAFQLGEIVADGFLAIQAKDSENVKNIGLLALDISKKLGIEEEVSPHAQQIISATENEKWHQIHQELDKVQASAQDAMKNIGDYDLSKCVSMGGWLRGLELITDVIKDDYSQNKAELLNQAELAKHFINNINKMRKLKNKNPILNKCQKALTNIQIAMQQNSKNISKENVIKIYKNSQNFNSQIINN